MSHDPLCPVGAQIEYVQAADCGTCDLIAKVRADERAKGMAEDKWISAREAREYEADIRADEREKVERVIYRNCAHTKYVGVEPCWHDVIIQAIRGEEES